MNGFLLWNRKQSFKTFDVRLVLEFMNLINKLKIDGLYLTLLTCFCNGKKAKGMDTRGSVGTTICLHLKFNNFKDCCSESVCSVTSYVRQQLTNTPRSVLCQGYPNVIIGVDLSSLRIFTFILH